MSNVDTHRLLILCSGEVPEGEVKTHVSACVGARIYPYTRPQHAQKVSVCKEWNHTELYAVWCLSLKGSRCSNSESVPKRVPFSTYCQPTSFGSSVSAYALFHLHMQP